MRKRIGALVIVITSSLGVWMLGAEVRSPVPETMAGAARPGSAVQVPAADEEILPAPFGERGIAPLEPGQTPPPETAAFCDDANWSRLDLLEARPGEGAFPVDEEAWKRALTGTKAGLASWMSECHRNGEPIEIVAAGSGALLATYDPQRGLRAIR